MTEESIMDRGQQILEAHIENCRADPFHFFLGLKILSAEGPKLFSRCMADFQRECLLELAPSLIAVRDKKMPPIRRFWWERTKGASKDSDIAAALLWVTAFSTHPVYVQVGAADRDQAGIVKHRMENLLHYNRWLNDFVKINNYHIKSLQGPGYIDIVAADIAGSHGEAPDILVLNELSHVTKWDFLENMIDNARKVKTGVIIAATNAGFKGTKAEVLRNSSRKNGMWAFHVLDKPAPWIGESDLKEAETSSSSKTRYRRLWWGRWASGKGDALDEEMVNKVFDSNLRPVTHAQQGWIYLGGLDLGTKHDHAGVVFVGVNCTIRKIRVAVARAFVPPAGGEVDLMEVEEACFALSKGLRAVWVGYDPSQAVLMAQRLRSRGVPMQEVTFTPGNLTRMAESLIQVVNNGTLESPEYEELRRDFGKFNLVEKQYGHRLEAVSDEYGHADVGTGLVITLPTAVELMNSGAFWDPDEDLTCEDDELSEEDKQSLPPEFQEYFEDDDDGWDIPKKFDPEKYL